MRILHVINTLDPAMGGPPVIALSLAAAQAQLGHDVAIASDGDEALAVAAREIAATIPGQERVRRVPLCMRRWLGSYFCSDVRLREAVRAADFVHVHSLWDPMLLTTARFCREARKPYSVLLNGMLDPWSLGQKGVKKQVAMLLGFRRFLNDAAFLHCGNAAEVELIRPLGLMSPTEVVSNGIFRETLDALPPKGHFRGMYPEIGAAPFILFLSRLHVKKGLDVLADAFAIVRQARPDVKLVVAGPDGGDRTRFQQQIGRLGLAAQTLVLGLIYGQDKFGALVDANVFCLPSRQEGFSMAITEAMGVGTPVVVTRGCNFPEVAESGAGHVVELDPKRVADALLDTLRDPQRASDMGARGRETVLSRFTWDRVADRLLRTYQRYLS